MAAIKGAAFPVKNHALSFGRRVVLSDSCFSVRESDEVRFSTTAR